MDDKGYDHVPDDFPRTERLGALSGTQPKLLATFYQGRYYAPGCSPPEVFERWSICENLAAQLAEKARESKAGKRSHMTEVEILDQYLSRLNDTGWTSAAESVWVLSRTADILGWPPPTIRAPSS